MVTLNGLVYCARKEVGEVAESEKWDIAAFGCMAYTNTAHHSETAIVIARAHTTTVSINMEA